MDNIYIYTGPISSVTLPGNRDVMLHPGRPVTLPAENPYVATLVARGHLAEAARPQPDKKSDKPQGRQAASRGSLSSAKAASGEFTSPDSNAAAGADKESIAHAS